MRPLDEQTDVLADPDAHRRPLPRVPATPGLLVEAADGFVGAVVACTRDAVTLRDRRGRQRRFGLHPGAFRVEDRPVTLEAPARPATAAAPSTTTPSGSVPARTAGARTARASRLLVEGVHDAELLERIWGHDLRAEGVVVEILHGADDLPERIAAFGPAPTRRLGVLLDHLVPGSKEERLAARVRQPHVLVTGHPFVDVWATVDPRLLGIEAWPQVPHGEDWKTGVATRLGRGEPGELWRELLSRVRTWRDLDRGLIGAVEQLIDFVTVGDPG